MTNDRDYIVGATVILTVGVVAPNSQNPADAASVVLDGLTLSDGTTTFTPAIVDFAEITTGTWELDLDTTGMSPGTWTWRAVAILDSSHRAIKEDTLVLRAPFGPAL